MVWQQIVHETCTGLNVEPSITNRNSNEEIIGVEFRCPRELTEDERRSILRHLPIGIRSQFVVAPKNATLEFLQGTMQMVGAQIEKIMYAQQDRALLVTMVGQELSMLQGDDGFYLKGFLHVLKEDGAVDEWDVICKDASGEDQVLHSDVKNFVPPTKEEMRASLKKLLLNSAMRRLQEVVEEGVKMTDDTEKIEHPQSPRTEPERTTRISDDDVLNLKISLETAQDVNDFLKGLE